MIIFGFNVVSMFFLMKWVCHKSGFKLWNIGNKVDGEGINNIIDFGFHLRCLIKCLRVGIV